jgi:two-component system response regulator FlrC
MPHHILFVDDEVPIRETLSLYFKMNGIDVMTAETGEEALSIAAKNNFSLLILDINLGGENGLELLDSFRRIYPKLPIIMFTQLSYDPVLMKEALSRGANAYMIKTESLDKLLDEVRRLIEIQPAAQVLDEGNNRFKKENFPRAN